MIRIKDDSRGITASFAELAEKGDFLEYVTPVSPRSSKIEISDLSALSLTQLRGLKEQYVHPEDLADRDLL
jgi:hypothetical protein